MDAEKMSALDVILEKESCEGTYCGAPVHPYQTFEDARAELSALRAENARMREALEYVSQALLSIRENGVFQYLPEEDGIATGAIETARAALGGRDD